MKSNIRLNIKSIFVIIIILPYFTGIVAAEDWPMFQHDPEHTGQTQDVINNPEDFEIAWIFTPGADIESSPVVSGDYIYIGSDDSYLYSLNKNTGEVKWKFKTDGKIKSSPAISGNNIFIGSDNGAADAHLYNLDKNTGELIWDFKPEDWLRIPLTADDNYIYVVAYENLYCLDKDTGELIWRFESEEKFTSPVISGNYVYIGSVDGFFYSLNKNTGEIKWKFKAKDSIQLSPAVSGNYVYFASCQSGIYVYSLDKITGELKWMFQPDEKKSCSTGREIIVSTLAVSGNYIYALLWDDTIYSLDKDTGKLTWRFEGIHFSSASAPIISGNYILLSNSGGGGVIDKNTGEAIWSDEELPYTSWGRGSGSRKFQAISEDYFYFTMGSALVALKTSKSKISNPLSPLETTRTPIIATTTSTLSNEDMPTPKTQGFEIIIAIAGMLIVGYIIRRKKLG